jgi:hypothetical protein
MIFCVINASQLITNLKNIRINMYIALKHKITSLIPNNLESW